MDNDNYRLLRWFLLLASNQAVALGEGEIHKAIKKIRGDVDAKTILMKNPSPVPGEVPARMSTLSLYVSHWLEEAGVALKAKKFHMAATYLSRALLVVNIVNEEFSDE